MNATGRIVSLTNNLGDANTHRIEKNFYPVYRLNGLQYEVALNTLAFYNSWHNVSTQNNNRTFKYNNGKNKLK